MYKNPIKSINAIKFFFKNICHTKYSIKIVLNKIIEFLYIFLLQPKNPNEEEHRKELICNILLIFAILLLFFLDILVFINFSQTRLVYSGINPTIMLFITTTATYLLYLSRIGYTNYVAPGIIWLLITGGTYGQFMWGADLPSIILIWSFVITASSILISTAFSFYLSIAIGLGTIILQILNSKNIFQPINEWKTHNFRFDDAIEYALVFILIAGVSWISNREIYRSLNKARLAKDTLQKERDQLEIKVLERTEQLHKAQIEKINSMYQMVEFGRISSGLFHDLISPLNTLSLSFSQIDEINKFRNHNYFATQEYLARINSIRDQVNHCISLSRRLIEYIEIARRQISHKKDEAFFEVNKEIKSTVSILNTRARQNDVHIVFIKNKDVNLYGSPTLFTHIITNLISNAIDAYKTRQKIDREYFNEKSELARKVIIYCTKNRRIVEIRVKDFGSGIPTEVQPHIFKTFFTTKSQHGCGIGLSATKHTIEKYFNGDISFISKLGQGTTFIIKLPIRTKFKDKYLETKHNAREC